MTKLRLLARAATVAVLAVVAILATACSGADSDTVVAGPGTQAAPSAPEPAATTAPVPFPDESTESTVPDPSQPAGEQPAGEQPAGEQPAGEQPAGEQPAGEQPAGAETDTVDSDDAAMAEPDPDSSDTQTVPDTPTVAPTAAPAPTETPVPVATVPLPAVDVVDLGTGQTTSLANFARPGPTLVWFWAPH